MLQNFNTYDLILTLFRKELKVRYKSLSFGYFWSIGNPLAYAFLYVIVFEKILKIDQPNYPLFLVSGLFPWQWLSNSINVGCMTFLGNAPIIKKTLFPRHLIPLVVSLQDGFHFLVSLPIVFAFMYHYEVTVNFGSLAALPLLFLIQLAMGYALNLLIATLNLFFRDLERVIAVMMTFAFYMTPVLYPASKIPERFQSLLLIHPFAGLMMNWRNIFTGNEIQWNYMLSSTAWALVLIVVAKWIYKKLSWKFAEVL